MPFTAFSYYTRLGNAGFFGHLSYTSAKDTDKTGNTNRENCTNGVKGERICYWLCWM